MRYIIAWNAEKNLKYRRNGSILSIKCAQKRFVVVFRPTMNKNIHDERSFLILALVFRIHRLALCGGWLGIFFLNIIGKLHKTVLDAFPAVQREKTRPRFKFLRIPSNDTKSYSRRALQVARRIFWKSHGVDIYAQRQVYQRIENDAMPYRL